MSFLVPDGLGSCTMTDEDYRSTRKGQSLEVFDTLYEAKQHLNFKPPVAKWFRGFHVPYMYPLWITMCCKWCMPIMSF